MFSGSWIGTDTEGQSDYFGPVVSVAVLVFDSTAQRLATMIPDTLNDADLAALATHLRSACVNRYVEIGPERYNELIEQGAMPSRLIAWSQANAVAKLLRLGAASGNVLVNHPDAAYVAFRLSQRFPDRQLTIRSAPDHEDVAIQVARIIARWHYLSWLSRTSQTLKTRLPTGTGVEAQSAMRQFSANKLRSVAKLDRKG